MKNVTVEYVKCCPFCGDKPKIMIKKSIESSETLYKENVKPNMLFASIHCFCGNFIASANLKAKGENKQELLEKLIDRWNNRFCNVYEFEDIKMEDRS